MSTSTLTTSPPALDVLRRPRVVRWATWLIPVHAALLLWGTWERQPSPSEQFAEWSGFVATDRFLWSHLVASIGGQTLGILGTAALTVVLLTSSARHGAAVVGFVLHVVGSGLLLAGFGVAAFAQPAIGSLYAEHPRLAEEVYQDLYTPTAVVVLLGGAALFAISTIWTGRAARTFEGVPAWAALGYAVAGPLFGIVGVFVGPAQHAGAIAMAAFATVIAAAVHRRGAAASTGAIR